MDAVARRMRGVACGRVTRCLLRAVPDPRRDCGAEEGRARRKADQGRDDAPRAQAGGSPVPTIGDVIHGI